LIALFALHLPVKNRFSMGYGYNIDSKWVTGPKREAPGGARGFSFWDAGLIRTD
jgi:hypothetical protein